MLACVFCFAPISALVLYHAITPRGFDIFMDSSLQLLRLSDDFIAIYDYDGSIPASYTCVNGGTAQMDIRWVYEFDNCLVGEMLYDGHAVQGFPDGPEI